MKVAWILLICVVALHAQNQPLKKFTVVDTAKCRVLYVNSEKYVAVKFNINNPRGRAFKLYNDAGKITAEGRLDKVKTVRFDFTNRMPGVYFLFVYDAAGKAIFRRKIENPRGQPAPTIKARARR